jgi:hypothetical protein
MSRISFSKLRHFDLRPIVDGVLWLVLPESFYRKLPDDCEMCGGQRGGVRGNENVLERGGVRVVMCDYCSVGEQPYSGAGTNSLGGC